MMNTPKIRFSGYTEAWEQRKVLDLLIQPVTDGPHETPELVEEGVPFISVDAIVDNKIDFNRKRGNISEEYDELCCKKYKPQLHDVYLVKSGSTVGKVAIVETTDRFNIWSPLAAMRCGEKTHPYFLYDLLQTKDLQAQVADKASNGTQPNLSMRELEKFPVSVPLNLDEQKKIGEYFRNLDNLITLHQRKCDQTKKLKKYMLQKMFPQNGELYPEIRFEGFTKAWEQRKFGELYEVNNERNKDLIGYDKTFSIATMTYKGEGNGAADSSLSNYKVLRIGDIAFEGHTNKEFRYGRFVANDIGDGIMSPRFSALRPLFQMPVSFWKYYIHFEPIMKRKLICSTKAGTMMNELVTADFFEQSILVPSIDEQTKIGEFLSSLDHLITLHQRKCDDLKEIKKYMLQNMFAV